jgi:Zn-dependent alcohol dehydrogenase
LCWGYDVVGEIEQLGDNVTGFQLGDRVADMTVLGSNAAYRTLRASDLIRLPADVDAAEAAALILSWTTAYQLLHRAARVQQGQRVLVHGAAGAVGQALLTLGRMAGLELSPEADGKLTILSDGKSIGSIWSDGVPVTLTPESFGPGFARLGIVRVHARARDQAGSAEVVASLDGGIKYRIKLIVDPE